MIIRPARIEDSSLVAPLVFSAAPEDHEYMLTTARKTPIEFLEFAFRNDVGIWGYPLVSVAEVDGAVVATLTSYPREVQGARIFTGLVAMLRFYGLWEGLGVIGRCIKIGMRYKVVPKGGIYVGNVGTNEKHRGQGIAGKLYDSVHDFWRARGKKVAAVDVAADNLASRRVLDRLGYKILASQSESDRYFRMELPL